MQDLEIIEKKNKTVINDDTFKIECQKIKEDIERYTEQYKEDIKKIADRKDKITKLKVVCFDEMGKHPLSNYNDLRERDKKRFLELMRKYDSEQTAGTLDTLFNEICTETIFDNRKIDYRSLPIYNA